VHASDKAAQMSAVHRGCPIFGAESLGMQGYTACLFSAQRTWFRHDFLGAGDSMSWIEYQRECQQSLERVALDLWARGGPWRWAKIRASFDELA